MGLLPVTNWQTHKSAHIKENHPLAAVNRTAAFALAAICAAGFGGTAYAKADCGLIRDHDMRRQCYAVRDRKPSDCGLISDSDARRLCRAQSGRGY